MILRAAFWIAVVAVFIPREPDLGYGRPGALALAPKTAEWLADTLKVPPCDGHPHCIAGLSIASDFRQAVRERLELARAELKASSPPSLAKGTPLP
ncbi:hypothetical protein FHS83_000998 [Rhizomicrobium palustre]|jgi:hypothetical protein|uniref:Uncharacterized protein n=1 Tax=Rhizomicrobium palustre TaxID=189966 RepID=A0A846MXD2_9PROT|nr:hypothetical protein [Rhizomicrobium palustre]